MKCPYCGHMGDKGMLAGAEAMSRFGFDVLATEAAGRAIEVEPSARSDALLSTARTLP